VRLRLLVYAPVHPGDRGGVQLVVNRLVERLRGRGHHVEKMWGLRGARPPEGDLHCPLPPLVWRRGLPAPRSTLESAAALARCCRHLWRLRPDVVNVHFVTPGAEYFVLLRPVFGYRLVMSLHGSDVLRPDPDDLSRLERLLPRADRITAVSPATAARAADLARLEPGTVRVIANGIDGAFWRAADEPRDARRPIILSVGRLDPVKGHDVLLKAFAQVAARVSGAGLVIVGGGGGRARLEALAGELGIGGAVEFAGELAPSGVRARMRQAACFALSSRSEGWPLAPLEAMAAGLPVVATRVGAMPDILEPDAGVLVSPEDPSALAEALARVLTDTTFAARLRRAGAARVARFEAADADAAYEHVLMEARLPGGPC